MLKDDNICKNGQVITTFGHYVRLTMVSPLSNEVVYIRLALKPYFGFGTTFLSVTIAKL